MNLKYQKISWSYNTEKLLTFTDSLFIGNDQSCISIPYKHLGKLKQILNLPYVATCLYFNLPAGYNGLIHNDRPDNSLTWALNLPLTTNCSTMNWYEQTNFDIEKTYLIGPTNGDHIPTIDPNNKKQIDNCIINQSTIVKINSWHNVYNDTEYTSKFISLRITCITLEKFLSLTQMA